MLIQDYFNSDLDELDYSSPLDSDRTTSRSEKRDRRLDQYSSGKPQNSCYNLYMAFINLMLSKWDKPVAQCHFPLCHYHGFCNSAATKCCVCMRPFCMK